MNLESGNRTLERSGADMLRRKELRRERPSLYEMVENDPLKFDLNVILTNIRHRKWTVFSFAFVALVIAYMHLNSLTPLYSANAKLVLETQESRVVDVQGVAPRVGGNFLAINTQAEIMRSRTLIGRLVDDMNLVEDPDVNPWIRPVKGWKQSSWGKPIASMLGLSTEAPVRQLPPAELQRQVIISILTGQFTILSIDGTYVFDISILTPNPQKSAELVNRLAELYILDQHEAKFETTQAATTWLSGRVAELKVELEAAEAEIEEYRTEIELVSDEELAVEAGGLKELRERIAQYTAEAEAAQASLDRVAEAREAGDLERIANQLASPRIARAYSDAASGSPQAVATFWDEVEIRMDQIRQLRERMNRQVKAAGVALADFETRIDRQGKDLVTLRQLEREAESTRLIYEHFLSRMKEISAQEGIQPVEARILNRAIPSGGPSYPRRGQTMMLALIVGFLAGTGYVVWRELYRPSFRSAEDLEKITGVRVMASVPRAPVRRRRDMLNYIISKPASGFAEAARNLRTSLMLGGDEEHLQKVVTFTSTVPREGKTTLTVLLAWSIASLGKRVLVIECDLRRRMLDTYFGGPTRRQGLISVLYGDATLKDVVVHDDTAGVDVILGEESPMNAADIFASRQFGELIGKLRKTYDLIVIDTPPVMAAPDARLVASISDAVLYSVAWDRTSRDLVLAGLDQFQEVDVPTIGLVLNQINTRQASKYGYGGFGQYYRVGKGYYQN